MSAIRGGSMRAWMPWVSLETDHTNLQSYLEHGRDHDGVLSDPSGLMTIQKKSCEFTQTSLSSYVGSSSRYWQTGRLPAESGEVVRAVPISISTVCNDHVWYAADVASVRLG